MPDSEKWVNIEGVKHRGRPCKIKTVVFPPPPPPGIKSAIGESPIRRVMLKDISTYMYQFSSTFITQMLICEIIFLPRRRFARL